MKAFLPTLEEPNRHFNICSFTSRNQAGIYIREIAASIQETSRVLEQIPDIDSSYKRIKNEKTDIAALKPEKEELSSDLLHGLYDKCRREIEFGDTVIPTTIPLDQITEELKKAFGTELEEDVGLKETKFDAEATKVKEKDESWIENTSLFVPSYEEER